MTIGFMGVEKAPLLAGTVGENRDASSICSSFTMTDSRYGSGDRGLWLLSWLSTINGVNVEDGLELSMLFLSDWRELATDEGHGEGDSIVRRPTISTLLERRRRVNRLTRRFLENRHTAILIL